MEPQNTAHLYERQWLASVIATAIAIAINHWFVLGRGAFALAAGLVLLAIGVSALLRRSQRPVAIAAFSLLNAWIVIGFGLMKGFWTTTLKLFVGTTLAQISIAFPKPAVGPPAQEMSGVAMFLGSLFVAHYAFETIAMRRDAVRGWQPTIASGALISLILSVAAYAINGSRRVEGTEERRGEDRCDRANRRTVRVAGDVVRQSRANGERRSAPYEIPLRARDPR
jgi:hypothetical protein